MPALNFQERFAEAVKNGAKRQTIRRKRKRPIKLGDTLYFKVNQRSKVKACRSLGIAICKAAHRIEISDGRFWFIGSDYGLGKYTKQRDLDGIAQDDGFRDYAEMRDWFRDRYGLPFEGVLIEW